MEILFQNRYVRSKDQIKEFYRYYFFRRPVAILFFIVAALSLACALFSQAYFYFGFIAALIAYVIGLNIFGYHRSVKLEIERDVEAHGKEIEVEMTVTEENIQTTASTGAVTTLEYHQIKNTVRLKTMTVLFTKARLIYIFPNDTFTVGDKDAFSAFLTKKLVEINASKKA